MKPKVLKKVACLGFGGIVASEMEAPNMLAIPE